LRGNSDGWLAEIDALGQIEWERFFDRGHSEGAEGLLPLADGGCLMALSSGEYNKFGQGKGLLWLVRCDAKGERLAEATIPDARIFSHSPSIAPLGAGFAVGYTTTPPPNICGGALDFSKPYLFDMRVAVLDAGLNRTQDIELPSTPWITTPALAALPDGGLLAVTGTEDGVRLIPISSSGQTGEARTVQVERAFRLALVSVQDAAVIVAGTRMHSEPVDTERGLGADVAVARVRY